MKGEIAMALHGTVRALEHCLNTMARLEILMTPKQKSWLRLVTAEITADLRTYRLNNGRGDTR